MTKRLVSFDDATNRLPDEVEDRLTESIVGGSIGVAYPVPAVDQLGDSVMNQGGGTRPTNPQPSGFTYGASSAPQARGAIVHCATILGHRIRVGTNFGVSGQRLDQMELRLPDVIASPNRIVMLFGGLNDFGQGRTATAAQQSALNIMKQLRAAGKIVLVATPWASVYISGSGILGALATGATSFSSPTDAKAGESITLGDGTANAETATIQSVTGSGPYTITLTTPTTKTHSAGDTWRNDTRLAALHAYNQWLIDYTRGRYVDPTTGSVVVGSTEGVHLLDWHSLVADPATGRPVGALQPDGTLTQTTGSANLTALLVDGTHPGQDVAHRMGYSAAVVLDRIVPPIPVRNGDNSDVTNLIRNGRCVGNNAGLATGYQKITDSGTFTATASKVARTDGVPGEAQQLKIGPGNTGQGHLRVEDQSGMTFDGTSSYVFEVEFETDPDLVIQTSPPGGAVPLRLQLDYRNSSGSLGGATSHGAASGSDGVGTIWDASGVLRSERFTPPATATRILADVLSAGIDTGTYRVLSARVRKVAA